MYVLTGTITRRPNESYCSTSRFTKPAVWFGMKSTVPVTISGFWYSSPSVFQYAVFGKQALVRLEVLFVLDLRR